MQTRPFRYTTPAKTAAAAAADVAGGGAARAECCTSAEILGMIARVAGALAAAAAAAAAAVATEGSRCILSRVRNKLSTVTRHNVRLISHKPSVAADF